MLRQDLADEGLVKNFVTDLIVRYRTAFFSLLVLLYIVSFNGRWRLGLDSSIYRGVASNLAQGNGFKFGTWATQQVYPGLPLMLAGINRIFHAPADATQVSGGAVVFVAPRSDTFVAVLLIALMGLATIALTYKLIRLHYPAWMATCVAFGVGINSWFLQLSNEILTDVPFLLGVVASLYGWELLKRAAVRAQRIRAMMMITPGLLLAGSMRPTFWVLALAWGAVCLWGVIRGPRRRFYSTCLILLLVSWTAVQLLDPRQRGFNPLAGGYEREALDLLPDVQTTFPERLRSALYDQLPAAFFGEQMAPLSVAASILLLASCLLLFRRHALWALMVLVTFAMTIALSTQPRYYTMVLPMLLLGWLLMLLEIVKRLPHKWGTITLLIGLGLVTGNNISASVSFIKQQRSREFLVHYKDGKYIPALQMCDLILVHVPRDAHVLGPSGSLMSYVTGIHVFSQREIIARGNVVNYPTLLRDADIRYAVFPGFAYRSKEPITSRLINRGILVRERTLGHVSGMTLGRVHVYIPPGDWTKIPKGWHPPPETNSAPATTQATKKPASKSATKPASARKPTTSPTTRPTRAPAASNPAPTAASVPR